ncbi:hypothetical protein OG455_02030 [Kitasatospora sp. NBC_01287]|uniref:hypothetical protein n=1 Tax=Kitasatospora sp. NBC_01287 TaxID=2903573 RepID=UPI00224CCA2B|nr:hypothetical protein [Kitasatospora sp. NBC_01287]MCX4744303.1 hypothetical protein [Kitasatospora sp. NBC_01287]
MSTPMSRRWQPPGPAVERLADTRATGALHTETGTVYLDHGAVVHADSPHSLDLGELLTRCGRLTPDRWQHTLDQFADNCLVGRMLVAQGSLTRGELELCHLAALHDAAFFALGALSPDARFEPGARHWLGPVNEVDPRLLRREAVRRRDLLERIWPWPQVDTAPVRRAAAPHGNSAGPAGSPRRRELLGLADGRRTPTELARLLGRSTYATIVEVRRLAAAGLIATPREESYERLCQEPRARQPQDQRSQDQHPQDQRPQDQRPQDQRPQDQRPVGELTGVGAGLSVPPPRDALDHRVPGATLRRATGRNPPPPRPAPTEPDIALLTRVRIALEARL